MNESSLNNSIISVSCRSGGIGIRARFRTVSQQWGRGSTPLCGTV